MALTTDEKIAVMYDRSERMERMLPTLVADVTTLKTEMQDIQSRAPSKTERMGGWVAIGVALISGVSAVLVGK